jgi:hypothetical protein
MSCDPREDSDEVNAALEKAWDDLAIVLNEPENACSKKELRSKGDALLLALNRYFPEGKVE